MVIGQEKGHGAEFRNGGSVKPWGNAKAQQYMRVAETEGIPIHAYIFTPGSYPIEDYPGAAQQIARNIYCMAGLRVPVIAVISEGGSGGAEAIGLADKRLMLSHGYYSVISPEGAAAIEGRLKSGERATPEPVSYTHLDVYKRQVHDAVVKLLASAKNAALLEECVHKGGLAVVNVCYNGYIAKRFIVLHRALAFW